MCIRDSSSDEECGVASDGSAQNAEARAAFAAAPTNERRALAHLLGDARGPSVTARAAGPPIWANVDARLFKRGVLVGGLRYTWRYTGCQCTKNNLNMHTRGNASTTPAHWADAARRLCWSADAG